MAQVKFTLFLFLIFFVISSSSGKLIDEEAFTNSLGSQTTMKEIHNKLEEHLHLLRKNGVATKSRKLLEAEIVELDYDYAGPNPKHDPRKGRGGGGRNP